MNAESQWYLNECRKDLMGEDSWIPMLGLLVGNYFRIGWRPGERESFEAWRAQAMGLSPSLTGDKI